MNKNRSATMDNFNDYKSNIDLSSLNTFFKEHGELKSFKQKESFLQQNDKPLYLGYIESGMLELSDAIHRVMSIVGYAFKNEYAGSYI